MKRLIAFLKFVSEPDPQEIKKAFEDFIKSERTNHFEVDDPETLKVLMSKANCVLQESREKRWEENRGTYKLNFFEKNLLEKLKWDKDEVCG